MNYLLELRDATVGDARVSDFTFKYVTGQFNKAAKGALNKVAKATAKHVKTYRDKKNAAQIEEWRKKINKKFLATAGDGLPDSAQWKGIKMLGRGGQGLAGLWVKVDSRGMILDRVVIKQISPRHKFDEPEMWSWPGVHRGIFRDAAVHLLAGPSPELAIKVQEAIDYEMQKPMRNRSMPWPENPSTLDSEDGSAETTAGAAAERPVGSGTGIVEIRGDRFIQESRIYRLYLEYCSHGSLEGIIQQYGKPLLTPKKNLADGSLKMKKDGKTYDCYESEKAPPPEPFLWFVLYHLMLACRRMEGVEYLIKGDIIHQDIKGSNVFLDKPDRTWYPQYPIPKVGDFGSARLTNANDPGNPWPINDPMTRGYIPPEYRQNDTTKQRARLTSAVNVWQSGMVIRSLMHKDSYSTFNYRTYDMPDLTNYLNQYSDNLMMAVGRCLHREPTQRWEPQQLIDAIENHKGTLLLGLHDPETAKAQTVHDVEGVDLLKDEYEAGMKLVWPGEHVPISSGFSDSGDMIEASEPGLHDW